MSKQNFDLEQLQRDFEQQKTVPCVKINRITPPQVASSKKSSPSLNPTKKQSIFSSRMTKPSADKQKNMNFVKTDTSLTLVLKDVVERSDIIAPSSLDFNTNATGFPKVFHRNDKNNTFSMLTIPIPAVLDLPDVTKLFEIDAPNEQQEKDIHHINVEAIQGMSETEIKQAQQELVSKMDPALIEMLRTRAGKKYGKAKPSNILEQKVLPKSFLQYE